MADQKLTDLPAIATGDIDNSVLLYCVDVTGGNISSKVTRSALYLDISNTFTKGQTVSPVTVTGLTLNPPTTPVGSASVTFVGGIAITTGTIAFATTAQSADYGTIRIDQSTLVNSPGSGTIPNAYSLKIVGPPIASTNVTISNNYAIWVASGGTYLQGTLTINQGSSPLVIYNPAGTFAYTLTPGAISASRQLNIPVITTTDTLAVLGLAQTFTGTITMSGANIALGSNLLTTTNLTVQETTAASSTVLGITRSSGNNTAGLAISPAGSTRQSGLYVFRTSDITTNYEVVMLISDFGASGEHALYVNKAGTGSFRDLNVYNNGAKLQSYNAAGTITAYVDFAQTTAKKIGFNVGLTNYIYESAANVMSFVTSSTESFRIGTTGGIGIISGQKFNLDGVSLAGDTYIYESSANVFDLFVGGTNTLRSTATAVTSKVDTITGTGGNTFLYINGNNNTLYPLSATGAGAIGWNFQSAAIDFWNLFTSTTDSFAWRQLTGVGAQTTLMILGSTGLITRYANITTAGQGLATIYGSTKQKSETGADANVLTYTPPAVAGTYLVKIAISVSAASAATLGVTITWKDSNGHAQAPINIALTKVGTAAPALTFSAAANDAYECDCPIEIDNSATNIVVKTTFSGTSIAYKISASVLQLA